MNARSALHLYSETKKPMARKVLWGVLLGVVLIGALSLYKTNDLMVHYHLSGEPAWRAAKTLWYEFRYFAATGALATGWGAAPSSADAATGAPKSIPILAYHGILENDAEASENPGEGINVTEEKFWDHMRTLKEAGYETITLAELRAFMQGSGELPAKPVVVTFDDGRRDTFARGDPILRALEYEAVVFVIAGYVPSHGTDNYYASVPQLLAMDQSDTWEVGSHSHSGHKGELIDDDGTYGNFLTHRLWLPDRKRLETLQEFFERTERDYARAQESLEGLLGRPVNAFAFPFGDFGQNTAGADIEPEDVLETAGTYYDLLFYQYAPGEYYSHVYPEAARTVPEHETTALKRIEIDSKEIDGGVLLARLEAGNAKELPFRDDFSSNRGWVPAWGAQERVNGELHLQLNPQSTSAATILDGSRLWQDYEITVRAKSETQSDVVLLVRFQTDNRHAACNFGKDFVHVEETIGGERRVIKGFRSPNILPAEPVLLSAAVEGRTVTCSINGEEIVRSEFLDRSLANGGVGLKTWHPSQATASTIFTEAAVTALPARDE